MSYKGTMRLAFEAALRKAGIDATALEQARPEQVTASWMGPRDQR